MIEVTENKFSFHDVIDSVRRPEAGAIVTFMGTVRIEPGLDALELEAYKEMTQEKLDEVISEAKARFSILEIAIIHRVGKITIGEDIVALAVSAAHRADAFLACRFLIDELKVTAPIWKKALGPDAVKKWVPGEFPKVISGDVVEADQVGNEKLGGMVDISSKKIVQRSAVAEGYIELSKSTLAAIRSHQIKKGDVMESAKLSALNGVKLTPNLIPHCHPIPITGIDIDFHILEYGIKVNCQVKADYKTGVEMEALTGVNIALLTIWDMVKYLEKDGDGQYPLTRIHDVRVVLKEKKQI